MVDYRTRSVPRNAPTPRYHDALDEILAHRPDAIVVRSIEGAVDDTYLTVLDALSG